MRIEHVIEDIIADTIDISRRVESTIYSQEPHLDFTINLPGLENLSLVKEIELVIRANGNVLIIRAEILTQNVNHGFAHARCRLLNDHGLSAEKSSGRQAWFLEIRRETIKIRKKEMSKQLRDL